MKMSNLYAPTLREVPAEAEIPSHQLMLRAGMIRKAAGGVYSYLPLAWRTLRKIEQIVREEMDAKGGQEIAMPIVQPAEIWQQTGRWAVYGDEMFRLKDRHQRDFCLGPTHEEMVTTLIKSDVRSYRQLPLMVYQIQNKYRDEIRPRFGLMRGREFIMKDLYSFDRDRRGWSLVTKKCMMLIIASLTAAVWNSDRWKPIRAPLAVAELMNSWLLLIPAKPLLLIVKAAITPLMLKRLN